MKIYWGDIHNHCGITYGYGSQKNALMRAASHLDFCAITGHAMWPDIYRRNEETAFVLDFHRVGFQKLNRNWEAVRKEVADANGNDLVTFQAYEMHSCEHGDHHIVSNSDELPLVYRRSPGELVKAAGVPALTVAHHIGYTPGYRGINWDTYNEAVTPLIEVCSKHGCAMSETAPYPYFHNMGPRDSRNTVYEGLRRGFHFGFVGSTDHHAGYPGAFGDGKMAVLATAKTREAIWEAMLARRTYAVTGDRIACDFAVNGSPMGSILPLTNRREINWSVEACYPIDKVIVFKNLKPIHIVNGETLSHNPTDRRFKLRIEMGWGNNDVELYRWDGAVSVDGGKLLDVEPCFKGRSVLAPTDTDTSGQDSVNDIDNRILEKTESETHWQCFTLKNISTLHPMTNAVIVEIDGTPDTQLTIAVNGHTTTKTVAELLQHGYSEHMQPWHAQAYLVHPILPESAYVLGGTLVDEDDTPAFYHMEVSQKNNHHAFVTPVWVE